jgi:N-acetylglutamate synthase-like GNAT family acetyltransferase
MDVTREAFAAYARLAGLETVDALTETYDQLRQDIEHKYVYAAFMDGRVVGSVRVDVDAAQRTGYLSRFGVSLQAQNSGIGKSLMNLVDLEMKSLGVRRLYLHTAAKVGSLMRFYYGRGFYVRSTSEDKGYIRALLVKDY